MATDSEIERVPGIRDVSGFFENFEGEEVVVRPKDSRRPPFKIEVLFTDRVAVFSPKAPAQEGDLVERDDPRGGVIEYLIDRYEFNKDPFGDGDDHWSAHLVEKRHVDRRFAQPSIVVNGGVNQFAVGDRNSLRLTNQMAAFPDVVASIEEIRGGIPRDVLAPAQLAEVDDALEDAARVATESDKPHAVKRALHGVNGVLGEVVDSARGGAMSGVKTWAAAATALIINQISGL
ncbi:hypothetical protein [Plantibacter flavus]|nr:hypothetical protein [Plantibacter flavus]